jgi:hypothetical protein
MALQGEQLEFPRASALYPPSRPPEYDWVSRRLKLASPRILRLNPRKSGGRKCATVGGSLTPIVTYGFSGSAPEVEDGDLGSPVT